MSDLVLLEIENDIAALTLNQPERRNPTSIALLDAMDSQLDVVERERARVLIVAGAGRSFCAGLDLDEIRADRATIHRLLRRLGEVMRRLRRLDCATIACVQGAAIGGGFGFLAACDFAITHDEAKLGYPGLATGLSPALMAPWLIRKIGPSAARSLLMSGGTISGAEAFARGIASHLAPRDELSAAAQTLAASLLESPGSALVEMKRLLNTLDGSNDDVDLDRASRVSAEVIASPETQAKLRELLG